MIRIIQMQIVEVNAYQNYGQVVPTKDYVITGLGLDGIVYQYDKEEKHWNPITTRRVNPLHKQPKKQRISIDDDKEGV